MTAIFASYTELVFLSTLKWFSPAPQAQAFFYLRSVHAILVTSLSIRRAPRRRRAGPVGLVLHSPCAACDGDAGRRLHADGGGTEEIAEPERQPANFVAAG